MHIQFARMVGGFWVDLRMLAHMVSAPDDKTAKKLQSNLQDQSRKCERQHAHASDHVMEVRTVVEAQ